MGKGENMANWFRESSVSKVSLWNWCWYHEQSAHVMLVKKNCAIVWGWFGFFVPRSFSKEGLSGVFGMLEHFLEKHWVTGKSCGVWKKVTKKKSRCPRWPWVASFESNFYPRNECAYELSAGQENQLYLVDSETTNHQTKNTRRYSTLWLFMRNVYDW